MRASISIFWQRLRLLGAGAVLFCAPLIYNLSDGQLPLNQAFAQASETDENKQSLIQGSFMSLHEPSGVIGLDGGTAIVIEDEMAHPLRQLNFDIDLAANQVSIEELKMKTADGFFQRRLLGPLDDLEGIARVDETRFFVIGSHDDAHKNKSSLRQKLILFTLNDGRVSSVSVRKDLYKAIRTHYPDLADKFSNARKSTSDALNIEGLAYDRKRARLHIGLRTPRLKSDALILTLLNPMDYLQTEQAAIFADGPQRLDLDKGGIRALSYDDKTDKLLIVSQRESGSKGRYKLWSVVADYSQQPVRLMQERKKLFKNVEGLTTIADGVLFVQDNGIQAKRRGASWFVLHRQQLGIDK